MKKIFFVVTIVILFIITGCDDTETFNYDDDAIAVSIILGRRANANEFSAESYRIAETYVRRAVHGGDVNVILGGGTPALQSLTDNSGKHLTFLADANNDSVKRDRINNRTRDVMKFLMDSTNRAVTPENNLLDALHNARAALNSSDSDLERYIVIMDTGISTAGTLQFQNFYLGDELESNGEIIQKLKDEKSLPDLNDVNIIFLGLGDVAYPQQVMTERDKLQLRELWLEILTACGANVSDESFFISGWGGPGGIPGGIVPNTSYDGEFPFVTPIRFEPFRPVFGDDSADDGEGGAISISAEVLGFRPNSSIYINENASLYALRPIANELIDYLELNSDASFLLVGGSAKTSPESMGDITLSGERAERVKTTLVNEFSLPANALQTIGAGANLPISWRSNEFEDGTFNENSARQNRAVYIVLIDSAQYDELVNHGIWD